MDSSGQEDGPHEEKASCQQNGWPPARPLGHTSADESPNNACQEQGADKELQQGVLILAVGTLAVGSLQVGVEAVLEVWVPAAVSRGCVVDFGGPAPLGLLLVHSRVHTHIVTPPAIPISYL